jgi:hypothetical protein
MTKHSSSILDRLTHDYGDPGPLPIEAQQDQAHVRDLVGHLAQRLVNICPASRELNHALNKLDEAAMWAAVAIERWRTRT